MALFAQFTHKRWTRKLAFHTTTPQPLQMLPTSEGVVNFGSINIPPPPPRPGSFACLCLSVSLGFFFFPPPFAFPGFFFFFHLLADRLFTSKVSPSGNRFCVHRNR